MKTFSKIIAHLGIALCVAISCFAVTGCQEKAKYTATKYIDVEYGSYERQKLDLYLPAEKTGTVGLILFIHGGAWMGGNKDIYIKDLNKWCTVYGYACASINYHYISDEFHSQDIMQDISAGLQKIKDLASAQNINIEKAMVTGSSAGGHLALLYAYKCAKDSPIKPVVVANYSGPTDLTDPSYYKTESSTNDYLSLFSHLCGQTFTADNYQSIDMQNKLLEHSPVNYIDANTVPTLICHAREDDIVPYTNATILKDKLDLFSIKYDLVTYENSGHSLGNDKKHKKQSRQLFLEYAQTYLG